MNFTLADTGALLLAISACAVVLVGPGYALARLFGVVRGAETDGLTGIVVGLATLPALDSIITRFCGLDAALAVNVALALVAVPMALRQPIRWPSKVGALLIGCWLALLVFEWVDLDVAGKLYQPLTIFDSVKHAATTQAIYDSGAPPRDAFFLRPERSSYYYFFYTLAALAMRLCGGLVDAKAAVGAVVFWTGIGVYGLVRLTLDRAGLDAAIPAPRRPLLIVAVLAAGGLDILAVLALAWSRHYWVADPLQWNEQVGAWFEDVLWVPHHVTALIAGTLGLVALCGALDEGRKPNAAIALAGICFAASLGLSVWVTVGFAATVAAWCVILLVERRWRALGLVVVAGIIALVLAAPQLMDLKAGRAAGSSFPIAAGIRQFLPAELLFADGAPRLIAQLLLLPVNYAIEFGALAIGALVYWRLRRAGTLPGGEFARVLTIAAVTGLVGGAFLRSTLFNNDLGWRLLLLPLLAATAWTIAALNQLMVAPAASQPALRPLGLPGFYGLIGLGWITVAYTAVVMRAYPFMNVNPAARFMAADPATERGLRLAFGWAGEHLPSRAVLQQNPTSKRAFAFGVYGRNQIGVADTFASLYGADPQAVESRLDSLGPIFKTALPLSEVAARASANGIDDLVVTAADPVWADRESFVWRVKPVYASARVRIIPLITLEATR